MSLAMSSLLSHSVHPSSKLSVEEDNLVRKLLLSHDPDGRHLDSEQLLRAMENILRQASTPELVSLCCTNSLLSKCVHRHHFASEL